MNLSLVKCTIGRQGLRLACLAVSAGLFAQDSVHGWVNAGPTSALKIVSVDLSQGSPSTPGLFEFSVQNISAKTITAFEADLGDHTEYYFERSFAGVQPNDIHKFVLGPASASAGEHTVYIRAVVFDDGTNEGTASVINFITFQRFGRILEVERIYQLLKASAEAGSEDRALTAIRAGIGTLPETAEAARASLEGITVSGRSTSGLIFAEERLKAAFLGGVRIERENALHALAKTGSDTGKSTSTSSSHLLEKYRQMTTQNEEFCKRAPGGVPR